MTPEQETKFCKAMTRRLREYERIIDSGGKGKLGECSICAVFNLNGRGYLCAGVRCPLTPCFSSARLNVRSVSPGAYRVSQAKIQYTYLLKKLEEGGFEYVDE